ncbi:MAG: nucleoside triphosphate pyrophosphohydrolase [Stellaceae bacterium]
MSAALDRLLAIMAQLRDPAHGCPWDREQNFATIAPYTIEEAYEVADAIARGDDAALKDELGDLLFQVVFHAQMAQEIGFFDFEDVTTAITGKMVRRHPHVFGDARISSAEAQSVAWEEHKAAERRTRARTDGTPDSVLDGVALALPALLRAAKIGARAARIGFDWPTAEAVFDKLAEETAELQAEIEHGAPSSRVEDEIGDLLFAAAQLARKLDIEPETALRRATGKFERRFRRLESLAALRGSAAALDELEELWREVKEQEKSLPRLERVEALPVEFATLRTQARAEGYRMLDRLATDWDAGEIRFDRESEALFVAYLGDVLAGVGGLTREAAILGGYRMRRFYVGNSFRRFGVGRALAEALLTRAAGKVVTVNAAAGSEGFWVALGFAPVAGDGYTHLLPADRQVR